MRPLTPRTMLAVWDSAATLPTTGRALALLAAACPDQTAEALARLSVGRRDARLLTLRASAFGLRLDSLADCPQCGDCLELQFQVDDVRAPGGGEADPPATVSTTLDGRELRFRLPDSRDMEALEASGQEVDGVAVLLRRCLLPAHDGRAGQLPDPLSATLVEAVAGHMAEADPQADVELALSCMTCGLGWLAPFDIASFFWSEVDAWARRMLQEIHVLARAYGWREADVLALSPRRRQRYLELVEA